MTNKLKIKNIIKQYHGQSHDVYMAWFTQPCNDKEKIKKSLYEYFKINNIDTCMGIEYINIYFDNMSCEFYLIKD